MALNRQCAIASCVRERHEEQECPPDGASLLSSTKWNISARHTLQNCIKDLWAHL